MTEETKFPDRKTIQYGDHWGDVLHHFDPTEVKAWLKRMIEDFPKENVDSRVGGDGDEYNWYSYDFDEINEWYAKWLQPIEEIKHD